MELILIILAGLLVVVGFVCSFLPVLPGPLIGYGGLLLLHLTTGHSFTVQFLIVWAIVVVVVMILDNIIPAYGTKKFGGSAHGVLGSIIGLVFGAIFFPPVGIIAGPMVGAFAGEMIAGKKSDQAFRSAMGSFAGFLVNTVLKAIVTGMMGYYYFINVWS